MNDSDKTILIGKRGQVAHVKTIDAQPEFAEPYKIEARIPFPNIIAVDKPSPIYIPKKRNKHHK